MSGPPTVSRRALLATGGGCFAGSLLLDSWLFGGGSGLASASDETAVWHHRWTDATQRRFVPVDPGPGALSRSWSTTVGDPRQEISVESVGTERVYVRDYNRLLAYGRGDGSRTWTHAADEGSFSLPTLVGDTLAVQENSMVHAVATTSGRSRWTGSFRPPQLSFTSVLARDGRIYLPDGDQCFEIQPETGFQQRSLDASRLGTPVAATDAQLFWWGDDGVLRATDRNGTIQWQVTFDRSLPPSGRSVAVTGESFILRHLGRDDDPLVTALSREDGTPQWRIREGAVDGAAITADRERVYVAGDGTVRAFDRATGERGWTVATDTATSRPVQTPETVYVPTADGVVPVDPRRGEQVADRILPGQRISSLAVVASGLYAVAGDTLFGLEVSA